ncbi:hypothetical protein AAHA92_24033 [Salvia divinorum]|uniref:Uncharacterized protein n=1 Tax=Salvia divinorum TaxID=28513 RepID=A0ABD1G6T4_SALDI
MSASYCECSRTRLCIAAPSTFVPISPCILAVVPSRRREVGSVSFGGLSHQSVEEAKLVWAPFKEGTSSCCFVFGVDWSPFFVASAVEDAFRNGVFAVLVQKMISSFSTEKIFYAGLSFCL